MADYEDQNSSEYKDMNQETQAADLNPHSTGNVPQDPNPAPPDQQDPPRNNGQDPHWRDPQNGQPIPPQNNRQPAYWQNPQHDGQIPPQNPGPNPYWQNQPDNGQIPPQNGQPPYWQNQYHNGQPPYWQNQYNSSQPPCWQNQPQRPRREKNSFATISLISGIFALLTLCCFAFPVAIICGVGAVCFAIISKKGQPFRGTAVAGIILGVIAVLLGIGEFFYVLTITNLMKDPANAAAFNEFFEQFQRQLGIN